MNICPGRVVLVAPTHDTKDALFESVARLRYVAQMYMNLARLIAP